MFIYIYTYIILTTHLNDAISGKEKQKTTKTLLTWFVSDLTMMERTGAGTLEK